MLKLRPRLGGTGRLALVLTAGVLTTAATVEEQSSFPAERMRASFDAKGVIDVEGAAVPEHLEWDAGLWVGYADDPLLLRDPATGARLGSLVGDRVGASAFGAVGLYGRVQLGFELPLIVFQARSGDLSTATTDPLPALSAIGFGDLRVAPKVSLAQDGEDLLDVAIIPVFTLPTGGSSMYRGENGLSFQPELAVGKTIGPLRVAGNFSIPIRSRTEVLDQIIESELLLRLGGAWTFDHEGERPIEVATSVNMGTSALSPLASSNQAPVELRVQGATPVADDVTGFVGGGVGIVPGWGTPDWRVFGGLRFEQRDRDKDGDGILDRDDACPDDPEDMDEWLDEDGCPEPDNDGDGLLDEPDECPDQPEDKDGWQDDNGCPDPDNDGDGVLDGLDQCPDVAEDPDGWEDENGCPEPDNDGDGLLDGVDECPNQPEDMDGWEDENGCPDPDNDGDGIDDAIDRCMSNPEDKDGFQDDDGCPDPDNDGDGLLDGADACPLALGPEENKGCPDTDRDGDTVVDRLDNCPDEPGSPSNQGCKRRQLVVIRAQKIGITDSVYFRVGKDIIRSKSFELLDNVAAVVNAHPEIERIIVEGHTDSQGRERSNLDLSQRRAASVVRYLVKKDVARERLEPRGYGEAKPIASNASAKGRAKNRRVVFVIADAEAKGIEVKSTGPSDDTLELPPAGAPQAVPEDGLELPSLENMGLEDAK